MKFLNRTIAICLMLTFALNAKSNVLKTRINLAPKEISPTSKKIKRFNIPPTYILWNDGCYHLTQLNPPGYIDANGTYYTTWSVTALPGHTIYCMPPEQWAVFC